MRLVAPILAPIRPRERRPFAAPGSTRARLRWPGLLLTPLIDTALAIVLALLAQHETSGEL